MFCTVGDRAFVNYLHPITSDAPQVKALRDKYLAWAEPGGGLRAHRGFSSNWRPP